MHTADMRRGFASTGYLNIRNNGGATATGIEVAIAIPSGIEILNTSSTYSSIINDTLKFSIPDLAPQQNHTVTIKDTVLLTLLVGDQVTFNGEISSLEADCNPTDNSFSHLATIVGAVDPNDKNIYFKDGSIRDYVIYDETVTYKIRFENIGTYYASRVVVTDTISDLLDISSIKNVFASHDFNMEINNNVITWTFENIMLPSTQYDPYGGHGFVSFDIDFLYPEEFHTPVYNIAYIKFDFEDVIATNKVEVNLLEDHPSMTLSFNDSGKLNLHPNPSTTLINGQIPFDSEDENPERAEILIFDITGREIEVDHVEISQGCFSLDISHLPIGYYNIQVMDNLGRSFSHSFVKE